MLAFVSCSFVPTRTGTSVGHRISCRLAATGKLGSERQRHVLLKEKNEVKRSVETFVETGKGQVLGTAATVSLTHLARACPGICAAGSLGAASGTCCPCCSSFLRSGSEGKRNFGEPLSLGSG